MKSADLRHIVPKLTILAGISVFYIVFFLSAFNLYLSIPISKKYVHDEITRFDSIGNLLSSTFFNNASKTQAYDNFETIAEKFFNNKLIVHAGIVDKKSSAIEWSTFKNFIGKDFNKLNIIDDKGFKKIFPDLNENNITTRIYSSQDKFIVMSFYVNDYPIKIMDILLKGNLILATNFIIFGICTGFILARQIKNQIISYKKSIVI
jgi:hypothetical protein